MARENHISKTKTDERISRCAGGLLEKAGLDWKACFCWAGASAGSTDVDEFVRVGLDVLAGFFQSQLEKGSGERLIAEILGEKRARELRKDAALKSIGNAKG